MNKSLTIIVLLTYLLTPQLSFVISSEVQFNGVVKSSGTPFTGVGSFKLIICNSDGNSVWSNDNSSSSCSEPESATNIDVDNGKFLINLGSSGMTALSTTTFNSASSLSLRVYFSDGVNGFERLQPDINIDSLPSAHRAGATRELANQITASQISAGSTLGLIDASITSTGTWTFADGFYPEDSCPDGFSLVENVRGAAMGCIQTDEDGTSVDWATAIEFCFDNHGGRLPSTAEWYISMEQLELSNETDDTEWTLDTEKPDAFSTEIGYTMVGNGAITTQQHGTSTDFASYRCFLPR